MAEYATLSRKERCSLAAKEKSDHYHRRAGLQLRLESSEDSGEETAQIRPPHRRTSKLRQGWNVDPTVHVITVGVRATVPIRNDLKDKPAQQKVQASMAHVAAAHLNRIVPQYIRRLCARRNKCINTNKTGVG